MSTTVDIQIPSTRVIQDATRAALTGKVADADIQKFLDATTGNTNAAVLKAKGSVLTFVFYSRVECDVFDAGYHGEEDGWGPGLHAAEGLGLLYTAYKNWDDFWKLTDHYHAQGASYEGGVLQINFLHGGTPVGQFNAAAAGIGAFEIGGKWKWHKK